MASLNLSVAACPLIQVEGWDGTLGQFETSLSASLGTKLPVSVGETVRHKGFLVIRVAPRRLWLALDDGAQRLRLPSTRISAVRFLSARVACVSAWPGRTSHGFSPDASP